MISIANLSKSIGTRELFAKASFHLNSARTYGLIGPNGAGKSTLFRILAGDDEASSGHISYPKDLEIGILRQEHSMDDKRIILDLAMAGKEKLFAALKEKEAMLAKGCGPEDVDRLCHLEEKILALGGYSLPSKAAEVLVGLGIEQRYHPLPLSSLSGGFKWRVLLAQVLISEPQLMLLDEPTNHLDIVSVRWLEKFLQNYDGCLLVISHDRRFLDAICSDILDIDYQTVTPYVGNYTAFEVAKEEENIRKNAQAAAQEREIAHKQSYVDRFRAQATKARQAQSRLKQIEKIEVIEVPKSSRQSPNFSFSQCRPSGKEVVKIETISKRYGEKEVLNNVSLIVNRGDRLAIIGPNGVGKSTLIKIMHGLVPADKGSVLWGYETHQGYFGQDASMGNCSPTTTVQEWLWQFCPNEAVSVVRGFLGRVLFSGDDALKKIASLSGGERARLLLAKIMVQKPNVIILDEPTNHLDIEAIQALALALKNFEGTVILVSHDRSFVAEIASRMLEITPEKINDFPGTFQEYLADCGDDHLDGQRIAAGSKKNNQEAKVSYEESKKQRSQNNKTAKLLAQTIAQLEKTDLEIAALEKTLSLPATYETMPAVELSAFQQKYEELRAKSHQLTAEWEELERQMS